MIDVGEEDKREVVFLAQLQGRPTLSWVAFGRPDGTFYAVHKIGAGRFDTVSIPAGPLPREERSEHPDGTRAALAYAGRVARDGRNEGVLAVMTDLDRLSRFWKRSSCLGLMGWTRKPRSIRLSTTGPCGTSTATDTASGPSRSAR